MDNLKSEADELYKDLQKSCTGLYILKIIDKDEFVNLGVKIDDWYSSCLRRLNNDKL